MKKPQNTPESRSQESSDVAKLALTMLAEGRMPSREEIERAAKEAMAEVRRKHPELFETAKKNDGADDHQQDLAVTDCPNEEADWRCPVCGTSCYSSDGCEHLVAHCSEDLEGARGVLCTDQPEINDAFDELYEAVLYLSMLWLAGTDKVRKLLHEHVYHLSPDVAEKLVWVMEILRADTVDDMNGENFELIVPTDYNDRLSIWFRTLFAAIGERQPGSLVAKDYLICHSPGLSWSGTNYWATDAIGCHNRICEEVAVLTSGIREVTQLAKKRIEAEPSGPSSTTKAAAWIRCYRREGPE